MAGVLTGIIPNTIKSQIIVIPNPKITKPFLVPHRFFSSQAIFPNILTKFEEKYISDDHNRTIISPKIICLPMICMKK